ncbi:MAG: glucose 1-dehydrogenase [Dehalococcoidia bacterium]|nr:glucose 1-dehydrogenase [Dehalococcoidia bacterium]
MGIMDGKVAVITGGASGIGEGTVRRFVEEGARVVISDLHEGRGHALAEELGSSSATFVKTDVSSEEDVKNAVHAAVQRFGRLDTLFNNAGFGGVGGPIDETDMDGYDRTMDVLLKAPIMGMKHAAPIMKQQRSGSIVSTASVAGIRTTAGPHVYSAAKAAVIHLTKSVAVELAAWNIRVNCVCPGAITTRIFAQGLELTDSQADQTLKTLPLVFQNSQPLKMAGMPEDIANGVLWLSSDAARFITGHALVIDGGITLHQGGLIGAQQPAAAPADPDAARQAFLQVLGVTPE